MSMISTSRASYQKLGNGHGKAPPEVPAAIRKHHIAYLNQASEAIQMALRTKNRVTVRRALSDLARVSNLLLSRLDDYN